MILIDAIYLNSFGGKTIIELFIKKLINSSLRFHILIDSRLNLNSLKQMNLSNYTIIQASHNNRRFYYMQNINKFSSIVCLSNSPPPFKSELNTTIFFHNCLLLNPFERPVDFKSKMLNYLKSLYISYYNNTDYNWVVQTQLINKLLQENLKINSNQISIFPVYAKVFKSCCTKKITNNFIYVSSGVIHKNHIRLIKAFIEVSKKTDKNIKLHLTLNKEELPKYVFPKNLKIEFHGTLSINDVNELYNSCEFVIYPSLVESFGLPLIEATNHGCKVIASDLPYVHEIIRPSLTFDPYLVDSISDSILKAVEIDNLPETKVLVENKLDNFIDFIISQDVQR